MSDSTKKADANQSVDDSDALFFHSYPKPGKLEIRATKPLDNQRDLALAYSPGVAAPCLEIQKNSNKAEEYTARGNLVGVISNGTAVLGLGNIGALASKPVMEGKAVLFKKFANIDVFDIEVDQLCVEAFVETVAALEPTFGGINLEDIKAPECFEIEERLRTRMGIPVFHDDQHGTAIIVAAAVTNALEIAGKAFKDIKVVTSGAGAAALACLNLLVLMGVRRENIWVSDIDGVVYEGRDIMDRWKGAFAQVTDARTLEDILVNADVFLGLSAGGVLKPEYLSKMAASPLILALANPTPEIMPELAKQVRPDAMICTGRSDYPNQVNNVLCFPYIFRGALDVAASTISEEMKIAAVKAIAALAKEAPSDVVAQAYGGSTLRFGNEYLIPTPFDQRLLLAIAPAVAQSAMDSGIARRPIKDMSAYKEELNRFVFRSGNIMKPIFDHARTVSKRVVFAEGEDERVLRAAQILIEDSIADPVLVGRPSVIQMRIERLGLKLQPGKRCEIINPENDPRYKEFVKTMIANTCRKGIIPEAARTQVRSNNTVIASIALKHGIADAMICGVEGRYMQHLKVISDLIGLCEGMRDFSGLSLLLFDNRTLFLTDTYNSYDPCAEELAETTLMAANHIRRFGIVPKVALLSHSNFGSRDNPSALKMRKTLDLLRQQADDLEVDGEMQADFALTERLREHVMPESYLSGEANLLVFPSLDAANIGLNLIKATTRALHVGPILLGARQPAHILTTSVTSRGVVNMAALAVAETV